MEKPPGSPGTTPIQTALQLITRATQLDAEQRASEAVWFYDQGLVYLQLAFQHESNEQAKKIMTEKFQNYADRSAELKDYLEKTKQIGGAKPGQPTVGESSELENYLFAVRQLGEYVEAEERRQNFPLAYQLCQKILHYLSQAYLLQKSEAQQRQVTEQLGKYGSKISVLENQLRTSSAKQQKQPPPQTPAPNLMDDDSFMYNQEQIEETQHDEEEEEEDPDDCVLRDLPDSGDTRTLAARLSHVQNHPPDLFQKPIEVKRLGSFWNSLNPVLLNCSFDKNSFHANELVHFRIIIENHSSRIINCIRVSLVRKGNSLKASDGILSDLFYDIKATAKQIAGDDSYAQLKQQQMAPYREILFSQNFQPEGKFPLGASSYYRGIISYLINKDIKPTDKHQPTMFTREYELLIELLAQHSNNVELSFPIVILP